MDEAGDAQGAIAEARVGRFSALANELQTAGVHAAIVEWVRAGCQKTKRKLPGRPGRDPHIELMVDVEYRHYRDMVPPEDLSEKALELTISEANNNLNVREIRRIVAERLAKNISGLATKLEYPRLKPSESWMNVANKRGSVGANGARNRMPTKVRGRVGVNGLFPR